MLERSGVSNRRPLCDAEENFASLGSSKASSRNGNRSGYAGRGMF